MNDMKIAFYVTYDSTGALDGCYRDQVPTDDQVGRLLKIDEATADAWVNYRANAARDGVELALPAPPAPPPVPRAVTRRQARQALLLAGLLEQVEPAIAAIADPVQRGLARIEWEDSQVFERDRPVLLQLAAALGLDAAALDQLFSTAAGL